MLACAGHWLYWYRPRVRAASPGTATPAGALYFEGDLAYRLWVPFPHQNLASLERAIGDLERFGAAVAELSGRELPGMPSFGASRMPPSSELTVASDATGERFVAVARVYPVAGFLARWAGRLAGNPLLAGGEATLDGRPVSVRWRGGSWIVASRGVDVPVASRLEKEARQEALAWIRLDAPRGYLPAGEYRLQRSSAALELVAGPETSLSTLRALDASPPPLPLVLAELSPEGPAGRSLALLPGIESIAGLPGAVALHRGGRRWKVPGERLLKLVGDGPPTSTVGGWTGVALEGESLRRAVPLGPWLDTIGESPLSLGVWIDIAAARRLVTQTAEALEAVPVVGRREARRWRALEVVLDPLVGSDWLVATIADSPPAVRVHLGFEGTGRVD